MILRPALPEDAAAMAEVHASAFDAPWSEADIRQLLTSPGGFGLLAACAGEPAAGFVLARVIAGEAEVLTLAVDPGHRRGQIGLALMSAAIHLACESGAAAMFLEVAADNAAAAALYARAGFAEAGRRRGYYRRPGAAAVDAHVLRLDLNSGGA